MVMLLATDLRASLEAFLILGLISVGSARRLGKMEFRNALHPFNASYSWVSCSSIRTPHDIRNALNETRDAGRARCAARIVRYVALPFDPA